jgi:hypothetical protein
MNSILGQTGLLRTILLTVVERVSISGKKKIRVNKIKEAIFYL